MYLETFEHITDFMVVEFDGWVLVPKINVIVFSKIGKKNPLINPIISTIHPPLKKNQASPFKFKLKSIKNQASPFQFKTKIEVPDVSFSI